MAANDGRAVVEVKFFDHFQTWRRAYVVLKLGVNVHYNDKEIASEFPCWDKSHIRVVMEQLAP